MGRYPAIFCDFKVHCSLQTVQAAHLCEAEYHWRFLGGNALVLQSDDFGRLRGVV